MDVRCGNRGSLPGRIGTTNAVKVQAREERKEKGRRDSANVDDSCTTDDQRKKPTYQLSQFHYQTMSCATNGCMSRDNNALVLVDQVGL